MFIEALYSTKGLTYRKGDIMEWRGKYVHIKAGIVCTLGDMVEAINAMWSNPKSDSLTGIILDFSKTEKLDLSDRDYKVVGAIGSVGPKIVRGRAIKFAYIISSSDVWDKVMTYNEKYAHKEWERRLFHETEDAVAWVSGN